MRTKTIVTNDRKAALAQLASLQKMKQSPQVEEMIADEEAKILELDKELEEVIAAKREADMTTRELRAKAKKEQQQIQKEEASGEESTESKWQAFQSAVKAYDAYKFCFHRAPMPRYFCKTTYFDLDRDTKQERKTSELNFYPATSMGMNFVELSNPMTQRYLRQIVEGGEFRLTNPDTKETEVFSFPRRVYTKLGNMRHIPDEKVYNMIDLSESMKPQDWVDGTPIPECPQVLKALLIALSGSTIVVNPLTGDLFGSKQETIDWLERWIYSVSYAAVGNNATSMPVIYGKGKKGKNAVAEYVIPGMLGTELCFTSVWDIIDGNFNSFKIGKVFMFIDEVPPREEWNKIKNLTGSLTDFVKEKYGPEFQIDNTIAWAMGTNQMTFPLPLEDGDQMMRVSPISVVKGLTFAEATYEILNASEAGLIESVLAGLGIDLEKYPSKFNKGDVFLRQMPQLWREKEVLQQFLNYLHYKHAPKDGEKFTLEPLRSVDWVELTQNKKSPLSKTVEYIVERNVDAISIFEVQEIYKICAGDAVSTQFNKHKNTIVAEITPMLEEYGYSFLPRKRITLTGSSSAPVEGQMWFKGESPRGYATRYNDFFATHQVPGGKDVRSLIYPEDKMPDLTEEVEIVEVVAEDKKAAVMAMLKKLGIQK